jgi:cytochrome P450
LRGTPIGRGGPRRAAEEADHVLGQGPPSIEEIERLDVADRVLKESLRLYPPAWLIVRTPIEPDVLGGYLFPAGAPLLLSQYVVHRHPSHWDTPEAFDPERWTPERSASRHSFAYFPFGGGSRFCTGHGLAMILGKLAVAMAAREYCWQEAPGRSVVPQPLATLRPKHGVWVHTFERSRGRPLSLTNRPGVTLHA